MHESVVDVMANLGNGENNWFLPNLAIITQIREGWECELFFLSELQKDLYIWLNWLSLWFLLGNVAEAGGQLQHPRKVLYH